MGAGTDFGEGTQYIGQKRETDEGKNEEGTNQGDAARTASHLEDRLVLGLCLHLRCHLRGHTLGGRHAPLGRCPRGGGARDIGEVRLQLGLDSGKLREIQELQI